MSCTALIRLLLIDDHPLIVQATSELLSGILPNASIDTVLSYEQLCQLPMEQDYDVIVSDLMVGDVTPSQLIEKINQRFISAKKVFMSSLSSNDPLVTELKTNGSLFLHKSTRFSEMGKQLHDYIGVHEQLDFKAANEFRSLIQLPGHKPLTKKQAEVMGQIALGLTNKEAARELGMSPETVRAHVKEAYARLGANSRALAVSNYLKAKKLSTQLHSA